MIQRLLNEDLKETITKEKKHLADDPGMVISLHHRSISCSLVHYFSKQYTMDKKIDVENWCCLIVYSDTCFKNILYF